MVNADESFFRKLALQIIRYETFIKYFMLLLMMSWTFRVTSGPANTVVGFFLAKSDQLLGHLTA
jgi:hypothetical protein